MAVLPRCAVAAGILLSAALADVLSIEDFGAVEGASVAPGASSLNRAALTAACDAALDGDSVLVPSEKEYVVLGGANCSNKVGVTLDVQGTLTAEPDRRIWENGHKGKVLNFLSLTNVSNFTVTGGGLIYGNGQQWWDAMVLGELQGHNNRPHLVRVADSSDLVFERVTLENSPRFNLIFHDCERVTVRYVDIVTDRFKQREVKAKLMLQRAEAAGLGWALKQPALHNAIVAAQHRGEIDLDGYPGRSWKDFLLDQAVKLLPAWVLQPADLNTDGIDPKGRDFHIHDCNILNDDDSIAVKPSKRRDLQEGAPTDCTQNILVENTVLTGFGASIGSVPPHADVNCVRNVTFRNISMPGTGKGIYVKSNPSCGQDRNIHGDIVEKTAIIDHITYEDVVISKPWWWAIWIGPQQQQEPGDKLGEKCALQWPLMHSSCPTQGCATFSNILLRNVRIEDPFMTPGIVMGNSSNPMQNITFDNVTVEFGRGLGFYRGRFPFSRDYVCHDADIHVKGGTSPVPCAAAAELTV